MATIRKRTGPGGRHVWHVQVRKRGWPQQTRTFDRKGDAEKWARRIEAEMERGTFVPRAEAEATTLGEALERYRDEVTPRKRGAAQERRRIGWMIDTGLGPLAARPLAAVRGKDIADYIRRREGEGAGANTIRLELALLSHLFTVARSRWGMESLGNPVALVRGARPRLPPGRDRRLKEGEEDRLLTAARAIHPELEAIIIVALETGMRQGEILAMRREHVDPQARTLHIPETKNGTPRTVPLSSRAVRALEAIPARLDGYVWRYGVQGLRSAWKRVRRAAGAPGLRFHDLRHEATSRLFEKGLNPMEVAAVTGHKTLQMLKRYTHLRAEDLVERLG